MGERLGYAAGMLPSITSMNVPVSMTIEEEYDLVRRFREGDKTAERLLVAAMMRHVFGIAMKLRGYGAPFDDMIADGCHGMVIGLRKFDVRFGVRLVTYVAKWISAYIMVNVRRGQRIVRCPGMTSGSQSRVFYRIRRSLARLEQDGVAEDQIASRLAAEFEVRADWIAMVVRYMRTSDASMNAPDDDGVSLEQVIASGEESAEDRYLRLERSEHLNACARKALSALDDRQRLIIRSRVMADEDEAATLQEIANRLGISRERVRQLEAIALKKMRVAMGRAEP